MTTRRIRLPGAGTLLGGLLLAALSAAILAAGPALTRPGTPAQRAVAGTAIGDGDVIGAAVADSTAVRADTGIAASAAGPVVLDTQHGSASYYANSLAGRLTASGVPYRPRAMVAAHRTLPFGTRLRVENLSNGRTVEVEVVDRGPFARGRVLDLSRRAAEELDFIREGHTRVRIDVLEDGGR